MASISSLYKAVTGMNTAQTGLGVTAHNISNAGTQGYTRQQLLQNDNSYIKIRNQGNASLLVGTGVSVTEIRQVRDSLIDQRFRVETSKKSFYQTQTETINEIEAILDEPYGKGLSEMLSNFWAQTQKLSSAPDGVEERLSFLQAASVLTTRINDVSDSLRKYQTQLDAEVTRSVQRINEIIGEIAEYNEIIAKAEVSGDNANDYRDTRNNLLDELATYGEITCNEDSTGQVYVRFEGHTVVNKTATNKMKLVEVNKESSFKTPVWVDTNAPVCNLNETISAATGNDTGKLKALLLGRGEGYVTNKTTWDDIALNKNFSVDVPGNSYVIPKILKQLDMLTSQIAEITNSSLDGTGIGNHQGQQGVPVFIEKVNGLGLVAGNILVNPELLESGGYNKLGTVTGADFTNTGDNSKVEELLTKWKGKIDWYAGANGKTAPYAKEVSIDTFYAEILSDLGSEGHISSAKASEKATSIYNITNERAAIGGVSTDEEFSNLLKYQYAYNASARMVTILDSMLDTLINVM